MMAITLNNRPAQGTEINSARKLYRLSATAIGRVALALALAGTALPGVTAQAATDTWVGSTSVNWADLNWSASGNNPPVTGDSLVFGPAGTFGANLVDNLMTPTTFTLNGISFVTGAAAYVINSGTAGVNGFTLAGTINNGSTSLQTINDGITLAGVQTFTTSPFGGNINIGGAITGVGGINATGAGTLFLAGTNTYAGTTTISGGAVEFSNESALYSDTTSSWTGTNIIVASGGTLALAVGASPQFTSTDIGTLLTNMDATSSGTSGFETGSSLALDTSSAGGSFNESSPIANAYAGGTLGLTKLGAGTLILSGSNTYTGATTITTGTVQAGVASVANVSGALGVNSAVTLSNTPGTALNISGFNTQIGSLTGGATTGGNVILGSNNLNIGGNNTSPAAFGGTISGAGGSLTKSGTGALNLAGADTYTGPTTISGGVLEFDTEASLYNDSTASWTGSNIIVQSGGTLMLAIGGASPLFTTTDLSTLLTNMDATSSATTGFESGSVLGLDLTNAGGAVTYSNVIPNGFSGAPMGLTVTSGSIALTAANTFTGPLTLTSGTITFTGAGSLGGGSYPGNIVNSGTIAFNNTVSQILSGAISGRGALIQTGSGTMTLSGSDTYTGSTAVNSGTLNILGSLGALGTPTGAISVGTSANPSSAIVLNLNGSTIFGTSLSQSSGGSGNSVPTTLNIIGGAVITLTGNLNVDSDNGDTPGLTAITSGTVNANAVTIQRDSKNFGTTLQTAGDTADGLLVNGGALNVTTTLNLGDGTNSSANMDLASGTVSVGGLTMIANNSGGRYGLLAITGGTYTAMGGIQFGGTTNGAAEDVELLVTGSGVLNTTGITFAGNPGTTGGTEELLATGGTIYIGATGISAGTGTGTFTIVLGGTSGPLLVAASAPWSSSVAISLGSNTTTFQTANSAGTPENISLNGAVTGAAANPLNVTGGGALTLAGVNTYSGATNIAPGATLALGGAGDLGSGTYAGAISNSGTFTYGSSATQTLTGALSGTGAVTVTGPGALNIGGNFSDTGPVTITGGALGVTGTGLLAGGNYAANISDNGIFSFGGSVNQTLSGQIDGTGGVTEVGPGRLILAGSSSYTGATTVTSGTLVLASTGVLGNSAITVANKAGFLAQAGTNSIQLGSPLTLNAGAAFSMADNAIGTLTLTSTSGAALNLGGTVASPASLTFDIGHAGADQLIVANGGISFAATPQDNIDLNPIGATIPASLTQIPLIIVPNGVLSLGNFSLATPVISIAGSVFDAALGLGGAGSDTELYVSLTLAGSANYYFTGKQNGSWGTIGNFNISSTSGTMQTALPNTTSNIFLTADSAANNPSNYQNETIDGNFTINSLSFTGTDATAGNTPAATASIVLAAGTATAPLVISAGNSFGDTNGNPYAAGTGLVVQAGSAAHTISANINLGNTQTWEIDNSGTNGLTVSGVIGDGSGSDALIKTGTGTLIFSGANTYSGGTLVQAGTLMLGPGGSLLSTGTLTVSGTGTFDLGGNSQTVAALSDGGVSSGTITASTGASTLTISNTGADTFSGTITDNNAGNGASLALVLNGPGNMTLSGSNNFTGGTTLNAGNLTVSSNYALGSGTSQNANAGLTLNSTTVNVFFTSANPNVASLNATGGTVTLGNASGAGSPTTLNIGGGGQAQVGIDGDVFSGTITDQSGTVPTAVGNLNIIDGGFVNLTGANTFTGVTSVTGSSAAGLPSELELSSATAIENSTLNISSSTGIILFTQATTTLGGLSGNGTLNLVDASSVPETLSIGNYGNSTFGGTLTGAGGINKVGNGTFNLSGSSSFTGGVTVTTGTLVLSGTLGANGAPVGAVTDASATLDINGGVLYIPTLSANSGPGSGSSPPGAILNIGQNGTGASVNISGVFAVDASNGDLNDPVTIISGTVSANSVTIGRGNTNEGGTPGILGTNNDGLIVQGGAVNIATTLGVGGGGTASSANMNVTGGSVTVGGIATITNDAGTRFSVLAINGGTVTDQDASGTGILIGANTGADAELLVQTGTLNTPEITLGAAAQTTGIDEFLAAGGVTNIGAGGILSGGAVGPTITVALGFGSVATAPTISATASWTSSLPFTLTNSSSSTSPIFLTGSGANITLTGVLSGGGGLVASGSGVLTLSNQNSYTGITSINGGTLAAAYGGLGTTSAITFGGGTLQYSGTNNTDYSPLIANSTAPISIDTHGENVTFNSVFAASNTGGLTVVDSVGGGSLTLTKANTYTAPTTIGAGGMLTLASTASLGNTPITVMTSGTFRPEPGSGNIQIGATGASLSLNAGATFSMVDGLVGTVTLNTIGGGTGTALNLGGAVGTPDSLNFDLGSAGADQLIVNNGVVIFAGSPQNNITLVPLAGGAPASLSNIPLLSVPNGTLSLGDFSLQTPSVTLAGSLYNANLSLNAGNNELFVNLTLEGSANYYFTGAQSASWKTIGNFATTHVGNVPQTGSLGALANIFLTADTVTAGNIQTETLDGNYTINSLSFTGTNGSVGSTPAAITGITLTGGTAAAPLVLNATSSIQDANGTNYAGGTGVVVQAGSAAHTIATNVNLGNSQAWEIDGSNPLTVTGTIADGSTLDSLTKTGVGELILSNSNTYDGGTFVSAGTLVLGVSNAIAPATVVTVEGTGTFDLAGNSQTLAGISDGGVSTGVITSSTGSAILTLNNNSPSTYRGAINDNNSGNGASLALTLSGTGTVTLSGSNRYTGLTTLNAGALVAANNYALGSGSSGTGGLFFDPILSATAHFTSSSPIISSLASSGTGASSLILGNSVGAGSATTLTITGAGAGPGATYAGTISDLTPLVSTAVGNLVVSGGMLTLDGSDTFTGTTVVSGTSILVLGNSAALQDSTVSYNNQGGTLSFGALTAATFGGLTGGENLGLANGLALTIGANSGSPAPYSGALSGSGSIIKSGTGTEVFSGLNTYTGSTTVNSGTLTLTNAIGTSGAPSGAVNVALGVMNISGASLYAASLAQADNGANLYISGTSTVVLSGNLAVNNGSNDAAGVTSITGGSVTANTVTIGRDSDNLGTTAPTTGSPTDGLYVNGGSLTVLSTLNVGGTATNSSAQMRLDSGTVTVDGIATVTNGANSRFSLLDINGGIFTDNDPSGVGIQIGGNLDTGGALFAEFLIQNGTVNTPAVTLSGSAQTNGMDQFTAVGGAINIGAGGIVSGSAAGGTLIVVLGSGSVATAPVLSATASWTSPLAMTLNNSSAGVAPTFQTSPSGVANTITLSGVLSGTAGGITQSGSGVLILQAANTYTGATTVTGSGGRLVISGSAAGTVSANASAGAHLEVDGLLNNSAVASISGFLNGTGSVGTVDVNAGGTLGPGRNSLEATAPGTLTANGNVVFTNSTSILSIRLGVATPTDSDQLAIGNSGAITLNDATLKLALGTVYQNTPGLLYVIVNGGAQGTGTGADVFANAPATGDTVPDSNGDLFTVYYGVSPTNVAVAGPDIDIEFAVAVPEPGSWGLILGGVAILCLWRRSRRSSSLPRSSRTL